MRFFALLSTSSPLLAPIGIGVWLRARYMLCYVRRSDAVHGIWIKTIRCLADGEMLTDKNYYTES